MSFKTVISAVMLLSAAALPALADDFAGTAARPYPLPVQQPLFGGAASGSSNSAGSVATVRKDASNAPNALIQTDALNGSSAAIFSTDPHMYDHLSGPEYRGGN
jgi:hypothetical protein